MKRKAALDCAKLIAFACISVVKKGFTVLLEGALFSLLSVTSPKRIPEYDNGKRGSFFKKIRVFVGKPISGKLDRRGAAAFGVLGVLVFPSAQAQAMGQEDVPVFDAPQPASWSIVGDQHPNVSEMDGKKVILFHRSTENPYDLLQYVYCDELEDCLAQGIPNAVEGIQSDMVAPVLYAYVYQNDNGEYIIRYREGNSTFERPVSFVNGVLTASGTKTTVGGARPHSGYIDDDGVPHVINPWGVGGNNNHRGVENLHTGEFSQF